MQAVETETCARITVRQPDGDESFYDITPDNSLIIGSSPSCSLRLESSDVASMHCLIQFEQGRLSVQDWYTSLGTFLNGERLNQPENFAPGDEVRIGEFRLTAQYIDAVSEPQSPVSTATGPSASLRPEAESMHAETCDDSATVVDSSEETVPSSGDSRCDRHLASAEENDNPACSSASVSDAKQLKLKVTELELQNEELRLKAAAWGESDTTAGVDPFDLEMLDLLKAEVQQLQDEVVQRDARIAELAEGEPSDTSSDYSEEQDRDNALLMDRLESLLEELQKSDERAGNLEDLLRSADESAQAEAEERRQLAAWVEDIEEKIGEREAEWKASRQTLQKRIDDLITQKERFDKRLREMGNQEETSASAKLIEDLRDELFELQHKLESSQQARESLRQKIEDEEFRNSTEQREKYVEQKLREQRLEMAQEQTQIARDRAEVARMQAKVTQTTTTSEKTQNAADCRVQAFREHLKDLHAEESKEREANKLTSRLARLWKRLEGN